MTSSSLRARQHERTRGGILRAALAIVSDDGTERMTIERIATGAGMSRATLYAHYPAGHDEIIRAAYDLLGADLLADARARAEGAPTWIDRLCAYAEAMIDLAGDAELGFFYNITGPGRVGLNREHGSGSVGYRDAFRAELDSAQAEGEVAADIDAAATASLLVGMMRQAGIDIARDGSLARAYLAAFRRTLQAFARR